MFGGFANSQLVKLAWQNKIFPNLDPNPNPHTKPQPNTNPYPNTKPQPNPSPNFISSELAKPCTKLGWSHLYVPTR